MRARSTALFWPSTRTAARGGDVDRINSIRTATVQLTIELAR
jgi:hypothetical protein